MIEVQPIINGSKYAHLDPIVDILLSEGNSIVLGNKRWQKTKDGWLCVLAKPIDFSLIKCKLKLPPSIKLYPDRNSISCDITWSAIVKTK